MYIYIYICIYIYMCIYIHTYIYIYGQLFLVKKTICIYQLDHFSIEAYGFEDPTSEETLLILFVFWSTHNFPISVF